MTTDEPRDAETVMADEIILKRRIDRDECVI